MKRFLFTFMAIMFFVMQGWTQTTLNESFEGATFPPEDWTIATTSGSGSWESSTYLAHTGTKSASSVYASDGCTRWLITPKLSVTSDATNFTFWIATDNWYSDGDNIDILVSTTNNETSSFSTTSLLFLNQDSVTTTWKQYSVDLSTYVGSEIYVAFRVIDNNGFNTFIDDVTGPNLFVPTCPKPTALTISNITTTDADLDWTDATGTLWNIQYMPASSTNWANATTIYGVTSNPYNIQGLNPATLYKARVQRDCSSEQSEWSIPISFRTVCGGSITTFPWSEGFENPNWEPAAFPGNSPAPVCWTVVNKGADGAWFYWTHSSSIYTNVPSHTGTGHAMCKTDHFGSASNHNDWLITPQIEFQGHERLRFWAMRANSTTSEPDEISIFISDENTTLSTTGMGQYDNMPNFTQIFNQMLPIGSWQEYEIDLSQYSGNRYIAFVRQNTPDGYYLRLDDILVETIPSCNRPTNVITSNITTNSATISWTNGDQSNTSWYVYFPNSSGYLDSVQVSSNPYILQNLTPATNYYIYVKTDCSNDLSEASNTISFQTACNTITTLPWSENFDSYGTGINSFPTCWSRINTYSTNYPCIDGTNHSSAGYGSLYFYRLFNTYNIGVTPAFDSSIPINTLKAKFYGKSFYLSPYQALIVGVMTDPNNPATFDSITTVVVTPSWTQYEVIFNSYTGNGSYIAFKNPASSITMQGGSYIDDLIVDAIPTCTHPTNVATTNEIGTSVDVTFTPGNTTDNSWYVFYKPTSLTTWDSINVTSIPATLSNLALQTSYDIYVKTDCGNGTNSNASTIITYTTPCSSDAINIFPWTEGFENGISCWQQEHIFGTTNWTTTVQNAQTPIYAGIGFANIVGTQGGNFTTKLISPLLDLTSLSNPYISFWHMQRSYISSSISFIDDLKVFYRNAPTNAWVELVYYPSSINTYQKDSIALPNPSTTYQIAFEGHVTNAYGVAIDEIEVYDELSTPCLPPTALSVNNITNTTADVSWIDGNQETAWQVRLGLNGTPIDVTTTSYQLTNLAAGSNDTVYVRANCGVNYSAWVSETFTTTQTYQLPTVITAQPLGTLQTSTTLNGSYIEGTNPILVKGFQWKQSNTSTWTIVPVSAGTTPFVYALNGLTANTQYEFRAYVETSLDTTYGSTLQFTTLANTPPTVTTDSIDNITQTSATFYGTITQGTEQIEARGFEYKLSSETWEDAINISATGVSNITANPTTLIQENQYDTRAYARTSSDIFYGNVKSFSSLSLNGVDGKEISIMMYPNPATNETKLIVSGVSGATKIVLSDVQGRILNTIDTKAVNGVVEQTIDVNNLTKGVYYVRIQNSNLSRTNKLIVK